MTFTEELTLYTEAQRSVTNIGNALKGLLQRCHQQGNVVVGVLECAQMLQCNPEDVRLCVLAETDDVTVQIHHKLVEAFCWENDIEVIKIDSFKKIEHTLDVDSGEDIGCLLIQNVADDNSADDFINNYYSMLANHNPVVYLPE